MQIVPSLSGFGTAAWLPQHCPECVLVVGLGQNHSMARAGQDLWGSASPSKQDRTEQLSQDGSTQAGFESLHTPRGFEGPRTHGGGGVEEPGPAAVLLLYCQTHHFGFASHAQALVC